MTKKTLSAKITSARQILMAGAATVLLAHTASAQSLQDWLNQQTMTGDWNGGRTRLANDGLTFNGDYLGEFADDVSGGKSPGDGYAQELDYGVSLDLGKLAGLNGTILKLGFATRIGQSVTSNSVGNQLQVQSVYGGETTRVSEISVEQALLDQRLMLKGGFYSMGDDFGLIPDGCDFQNLGFCAHPQNLPNSSGWADAPVGKWGGRAKFFFTPALSLEAGVYDVNPTYSLPGNGMKISTSGSTGALIPIELDYMADFNGLPGQYKIGGYYDTSDEPDVTDSSEIDSGRHGFYAIVNQMLVSFGAPKRGLVAIAMVSYSDPSTAVFRGSWLGGLIAQGPFNARPDDFIDIGYVRAVINDRAVQAKELASKGTLADLSIGEGVMEVGYGFRAAPWLLIHPNVQYVMDPGTFSYRHIPNAWVFGLHTGVTF